MVTDPQEVVELPRPYRWMSRYSPIFLCVTGLAMVLFAMFAKKPDSVLITFIIMGVGCVIVGALLPRIKGPVEVGTAGVKASVESIDDIRTIAAAAAETVAQSTIPDQPNKDAMVARQVGIILDVISFWLRQDPRPPIGSLAAKLRHPSRSQMIFRDSDPELRDTYYKFLQALSEVAEREALAEELAEQQNEA